MTPCFNEEANLRDLVTRCVATCEHMGQPFELVLVDDGSTDATWTEIDNLAQDDCRIVGVRLSRNHGHQLALAAGLTLARGDRILILDADLQDPPELLPKMMRAMDEGADVVYGRRVRRNGETISKKLTAHLFYRLLQSLSEVPIPTDTGDFRLMSRRALAVLLDMPERQRFTRGMVSWIGFRQVPLDYEREPRAAGTSNYPLGRMLLFALDAITGFSIKPLRIASLMGVLAALGSVGLLATSFISWLQGHTVPGWTSIIGATLLLGSMNLIVLGILGEYVGRIYLEAKRRPLFIIDRIVRAPGPESG